jgi:hypothetical protein
MPRNIRIANAHAFWGDDLFAAARLATQDSQLDWITLDFLAEVSMSILAKQRQRDPAAGYARDFLEVIESLLPTLRSGRKLRLLTNAGGLDPRACAAAVAEILRRGGCRGIRIGIVSGDDCLSILRESPRLFPHSESQQPLAAVADRLVTANAYLGAAPAVEAINGGAQIVITGRLADPSLTVAPCIAHFGWSLDDYQHIAAATVAGHLIECGTQVTGGISTDWLQIPDPAHIGVPIAEVSEDGSCIITKPAGTGGCVTEQTVKEQLVYEIGDPGNYLSPDATVSFLSLAVNDLGNDRVRISGATGRPPPDSHKVSATYRTGFRASGTLTIYGRDCRAKAERCGQIVLERLNDAGCKPERSLVECLGGNDPAVSEVVMRITVADSRRDVVDRFTKELMPLVTSGPQGTTGYAEGRPAVREVFGYWPTLIPRSQIHPVVEFLET